MLLRVKLGCGVHTRGRDTYKAGESFEGTERELNAFGDKLERVEQAEAEPAKAEAAEPEQASESGEPEQPETEEGEAETAEPEQAAPKKRGRPRKADQ